MILIQNNNMRILLSLLNNTGKFLLFFVDHFLREESTGARIIILFVFNN